MVERVSIWSPHNNNNFNTINKMILESEILRQAINDCGSMVRKYQFKEDKNNPIGTSECILFSIDSIKIESNLS